MSAVFNVLGSILMGMGKALLTEKFLKWALVKGLEILVRKTEATWDDELLAKAKEQWASEEK